ncbi:MAG TPA: protein-glutamate O-methyltransferase CheR [Burkholderiales bacterium]|nr:protein-glutamate O-methyltransferase CheR [Burkholderiales bacterium]
MTFSADTLREARLAINDDEFNNLRKFIHTHTGIALADHKRALVCARLAKRLRHHQLSSYTEYYDLLTRHDHEERELVELINAITTNKTDFFREAHHFQFLTDTVFPAMREANRRRIRLWCAGTASGEEAYTLAITVCESFASLTDWDVRILATDIDTNVLERAENGVYPEEVLERVPAPLRGRYFQRGVDENAGYVRVKPQAQSLIYFRRLNLMDESWPMQGPFDVIFCRNVLIYFDKATQRKLLAHYAKLLRPEGYLMLGHAEVIHGFESVFEPVGHSIYQYHGGISS